MKRGNYKRILSVMIMACMLTFTVSLPAVAAPEIDDRDPSAGAPPQGDYLVMKISPAANGTWTSLDGLLTVTLSNLDGNSICWSSNVAVNRVFLKFAAGGDIFDYDPPSTGLHCLSTSSGQNISHITFYYYAPSEEDPSIQLSKSGTLVLTNDYPQAGDTIDYTFIVTNNGNVTLNDIELDDPLVDVSGGPIASLAPGASDNDTFTATYTLTQDDIDAGTLTNTATVTGNFGTTTVTDDDSDEQTLKPNADIALVKTGVLDVTNASAQVGDTIDYIFTITNTGNVTLTDITLVDEDATVSGGPIASLAPGASDDTTFTATYTLKQEDIDAGSFTNTATVTGNFGTTTVTDDDSDTVTLTPNADIALVKTGTLAANGDPVAGDTISYNFTVTNTGNVTLTDITLVDEDATVSGGPIASLAPGASDDTTFTATYTLKQEDIDAGSFTNTATVTGSFGTTTATDEDSDTQTLTPNADITLVKTGTLAANGYPVAGDTIDYIFTITNTGNVTLTDITLVDEDATVSGGPIASLAPGASDDTTFTATYTLTQEDIDAGSFTNTATVTGNFGTTTATDEDSDTQTLTPNADIDLEKTGPTSVVAGSTINYTITVTNTGNVTLYNALVEDPFLGFSYEISMLQPLETETFTGTNLTYLTSNADIETGVSNEATVEASPYANEGNDSETGWVRASDTHHVQVTASPPPPTFYTLTLNVSPAGSGTATANPSQSLYSPGTQVALNATAAPGYVFTKWIIDGVEYTQQQPTITMNSNRIATAYFEPVPEPVTYTLTLNVVPPGSGTATAAPSQTAYAPGTEVVLTATEAEDFFFDKWIIDGVEYFPTQLTIVMNSNRTATAYFDEFTDIDIEPPPPEAGDEEEEEEEVMPPLPETGGSLATMYWGAGLMVLGLALKRKKQ